MYIGKKRDSKKEKNKYNSGITLIALIVTIVILLILAGICINLLIKEDGIIAQAKWAAYVTEYESIKEKQEIYTVNHIITNIGNQNKLASLTDTIIKMQEQRIAMYPVAEKINIEDMPNSLKKTIKQLENVTESDLKNENIVNLYKVDLEKIQTKANKTYAINIISGMLYSIEYEKYQGKLWHTPRQGIDKSSVDVSSNIKEPGTYEMVVDAGQIVNWDSIQIYYDRYVENSVTLKAYTSDDEITWKEETIDKESKTDNKEKYNITAANNTRYLKIKIEIKEINGNNSELDYILVNFYKYRETDILPEIKTEGVEKTDKTYSISTSTNGETQASGTGTVVQTVTIPKDNEDYILDLGENTGTPNSTIKVTNPDGTQQTYTTTNNEEVKNIPIKPGSTVVVTTTLEAGESVNEVKVLIKEKEITTTKISEAENTTNNSQGTTGGSSGTPGGSGTSGGNRGETGGTQINSNWNTVKKQKYVYNNGGTGWWQKCLVNETEVDETGIIRFENENNKRIKITYQISADGTTWSIPFTNIQNAENTKYLKVIVEYQTINGVEYGDTSSNKIKVILNDGSWKITFKDEQGKVLLLKRVYFENSNKQATITIPNLGNAENKYTLCKTDSDAYLQGTNYTVTQDTTFIVYTIEKPEISIQDITTGEFKIKVNTNYKEGILTEYKYYVSNELKSSGTTNAEYTVTGLTDDTQYLNIYVEAYFNTAKLKSNLLSTITNAEGIDVVWTNDTTANRTIDGKKATYQNPIIPVGFSAVNTEDAKWNKTNGISSQWNNGLVIKNATDGNEFVWVPVDGVNVKYEKWCTTATDAGTSYATCADIPSSSGLDIANNVKAYGGFWVARYEAGLPANINQLTGNRNVVDKPLSKAGIVPWNYIDWNTSKASAESMYANNYVQSGLINGTQWDTIMKWLQTAGYDVSNERNNWGVFNINPITLRGGKYSYISRDGGYKWTYAEAKPAGPRENYMIKTGASNNTKTKNIYDLAGNVGEMTCEQHTKWTDYFIIRGSDHSNYRSADVRHCEAFSNFAGGGSYGFRVQLFVK